MHVIKTPFLPRSTQAFSPHEHMWQSLPRALTNEAPHAQGAALGQASPNWTTTYTGCPGTGSAPGPGTSDSRQAPSVVAGRGSGSSNSVRQFSFFKGIKRLEAIVELGNEGPQALSLPHLSVGTEMTKSYPWRNAIVGKDCVSL